MNDDDKVEYFFKELKKADEHLAIPQIPKLRSVPEQKQKSFFMYAAAMILFLLGVAVYFIYPDNNTQETETFIPVSNEQSQTNSLLEYERSLSEWESPTSSLLEGF